jgi:diguanylate cyclase (GGDEF)-like protein
MPRRLVIAPLGPSQGTQLAFGLMDLPWPARLWWAGALLVALALVPWFVSVPQPHPPMFVPLVVGLVNVGLVMATSHRRRAGSLAPSFDYGGVATITLLVLGGPLAALVCHAVVMIATALLRNADRQRPPLIKSIFNLAWGSPTLAAGWGLMQLVGSSTLEILVACAVWWLVNGLIVGPMAALSQRRTWMHGVRLALRNDGWLRTLEAGLVLFAVLAWRAEPLLLAVVIILVVAQAMAARRLLSEYEAAAVAREEADAALRRAEVEATRARHDPLTRLPNRHALEEVLSAPPPRPAVLMIDLDHFKRVNDNLGHDAGDVVLVEAARAIRHALRPDDFCARLGGEEFCAWLAQIHTDEQLAIIAERVRAAVQSVRLADYPDLRVTASVGGVRVPRGLPPPDAVRYADRALYAAKASGRNRVQVYFDAALAA